MQATYRHGMLELVLPLKESAKPRRIEVQAALETKQLKAAPIAARFRSAVDLETHGILDHLQARWQPSRCPTVTVTAVHSDDDRLQIVRHALVVSLSTPAGLFLILRPVRLASRGVTAIAVA